MPRVCVTPGCHRLTTQTYCDPCRQIRGSDRRARQSKVYGQRGRLIDFYQSRLWKSLRDQVRREEPLCRLCHRLAMHVDHIVPRERGGPDIRENLQGLCHSCHSEKTAKESRFGGK